MANAAAAGRLVEQHNRQYKHAFNEIYEDGELEEGATIKESLIVQTEGKRSISRQIKHYNLDMIMSVAYRVNSKRGVCFRQWATRVLREYLTQGYTLNSQHFEQNAKELEAALRLIQQTANATELTADMGRGLVDVIGRYTQTFLLLQRYDEGLLTEPTGTIGEHLPDITEVRKILASLKQDLRQRGEAGELFAQERGEALEAIFGNLQQTVFGNQTYPTIESKAAHLPYFVIKNHLLSHGKKRSGACLFMDFLHRNNVLMHNGQSVINDTGPPR